jgi:hypothetical protein
MLCSLAVSIVRLDSDRGYSEMLQMFRELGAVVKPRAEHTEEHNSLTERTGSTMVTKGRAIRIGGDLPYGAVERALHDSCIPAQPYAYRGSSLENAIGDNTRIESCA